jgi:four helix bundle protein
LGDWDSGSLSLTPDELQERTKQFALRVMRLADTLTKPLSVREIAQPLVRCGMSVSANYRAARRARSRKEFLAKIGTVTEEADETSHSLALLIDGNYVKPELLDSLRTDAGELMRIFAKTRVTGRRKMLAKKAITKSPDRQITKTVNAAVRKREEVYA